MEVAYMRYVINQDSDEPIMMLDKHIGGYDEQNGYGIDGSAFAAELMALDGMGKKRVQVWINSTGGSVVDGYNICNAILKSKTKVDTYCAGIAASMAGVIFQCGRKRVMADYGILMYHNPYIATGDNSDDGVISSMTTSLNKIICKKSGMDEQAVAVMMDRTSFINAEEAKTMNLCDEIENTAGLNAPRISKATNDLKHVWNEANLVLNNYFNNQTPIKMKLVTNKLGLTADAAEASVLAAIEAIQNQLTEKESQMEALRIEIAEKTDAVNQANDALNTANEKLNTLKEEKDAADETARVAEATNMIKGYATQGRIKNDDVTLQSWIAKAKDDMSGVKTMLESLPLNKAAVHIAVEPLKGEISTSAASLMAKVMNKNKKQ
jgi:ATP-dependent protease ClpP protease subunit